ncbi:MAG: hypothetical protein JWR08_1889 [Enterovirga sp.]|nr:hypothetical protein [Enterovirga sp.]
MKITALVIAASLIGSAAVAQTTIIKREGVDSDTTVVRKETMDGTVVKKKVESTGSLGGCETKSVTRTNDMGDKVTKSKTDC